MLRAERHADADLRRALADGEGEHAVDAERGQEQRNAAEEREEDHRCAARRGGVHHAVRHRLHVEDRLFGIGRAHHVAHAGRQRGGVAVSFDDEDQRGARLLGKGEINRLLRRVFLEVLDFDGSDHSDDHARFLFVAADDAFADGLLSGPVALGEQPVHHDDGLGLRGVGVGDPAAPQQGESERLQVTGIDGAHLPVRRRCAARNEARRAAIEAS